MDSQFEQKYSDVLCTQIYGHNLQFILRRVRPMSTQLQIVVVDRTTQTVRNTIHTLMFEGVSRDDVNYHMLVYSKSQGGNGEEPAPAGVPAADRAESESKGLNNLLLIYPNGIICIYEDVLQSSGRNRRKASLKKILKSDYPSMMAPQIIDQRLLFMSGLSLISIEMSKFETEIVQRRPMSCSDTLIIKIEDQINAYLKSNPNIGENTQILKLTDFNSTQVIKKKNEHDTLCFLSFSNGCICLTSFKNLNNGNRTFHIWQKFGQTEIFQRAIQDADLDVSSQEVLAPQQASSKNSSRYLQKLCKVTCLDFLERRNLSPSGSALGLLLAGDALGFIYIIQIAALPGVEDHLIFMNSPNQQSHQDSRAVVAAQWISWLDSKFIVMTADGVLTIFDAIVDDDDPLADSLQATKMHQIQTFEELDQAFQFSDIRQLGNSSIRTVASNSERPAFQPDYLSVLWPSRILRKHDVSGGATGAQKQGQGADEDKIITQSSLHQISLVSTIYPLLINGSLGGTKHLASEKAFAAGGPLVFNSAMSSNGGNFLHQMTLPQMIPVRPQDELSAPKELENVFFIDSKEQAICIFSNVTGKQSQLFSIAEYTKSPGAARPQNVVFTDLSVRQNFERGIIKFLISWINPLCTSSGKKYLFTWVSFDMAKGTILKEMSNGDPPKYGLYATFLVGEPTKLDNKFHYDNLSESIICLDQDIASLPSSSMQTSKLRIFQFDPFLDTREVNLKQKVQHVYSTPLRQGKVVMYYNISENLIQFSKNRNESKYNDDDYGIYQNRNVSFKLAYDERVVDIRWYNFHGREPGAKVSRFDDALSSNAGATQSLDIKGILEQNVGSRFSTKLQPKAVIVTNQRIYIVDRSLGIFQNFNLHQHRNRLIPRSLTVVAGNLILFATDHHLYYLTQEKNSGSPSTEVDHFGEVPEAVSPSGLVLSFNSMGKGERIQRRQIVGALSDRVLLAYQEISENGETQPRFIARAVPLLEPLLLGYLATISTTRLKTELDVDLVMRACRFLDTNQISQNLTNKLRQFGLLNSEQFLYQNPNALQFDVYSKIKSISQPDLFKNIESQKQYFEDLFPNKDINTDFELDSNLQTINVPPAQIQGVMEDRNDVILKLQNDPSYACEREALRQKVLWFKDRYLSQRQKESLDLNTLRFGFEIAELLGDWQFAMQLLLLYDEQRNHTMAKDFYALLCNNNLQNKYEGLIQFIGSILEPNTKQPLEIKIQRNQTWLSNINLLFQGGQAPVSNLLDMLQAAQGPEKPLGGRPGEALALDTKILRLNLAFGEVSFSFYCTKRYLASVVNENLGNWLGYESMIEQKEEVQGSRNQQDFNLQKAENNAGDVDPDVEDVDEITSETGAQDIEEGRSIVAYLRIDEGSGDALNDISDSKYLISFAKKQNQEPWSSQPLAESEPMDTEDKWGKETSPAYGFNLAALDPPSLMMPANRINQNFSLEFWAMGDAQTITLAGLVKIDLQQSTLIAKSGPKQIKTQGGISWPSWNHFALSNSNKSGIKLFINASLACHDPICVDVNFKKDVELIKADLGSGTRFEITELRLWSISLNQLIVQENYRCPLAMLHEQKRKIKIDIKKQKKVGGGGLGGLGKPGLGGLGKPKSAFNTNAPKSALSGLSKLDKKPENAIEPAPSKQAFNTNLELFDVNFEPQPVSQEVSIAKKVPKDVPREAPREVPKEQVKEVSQVEKKEEVKSEDKQSPQKEPPSPTRKFFSALGFSSNKASDKEEQSQPKSSDRQSKSPQRVPPKSPSKSTAKSLETSVFRRNRSPSPSMSAEFTKAKQPRAPGSPKYSIKSKGAEVNKKLREVEERRKTSLLELQQLEERCKAIEALDKIDDLFAQIIEKILTIKLEDVDLLLSQLSSLARQEHQTTKQISFIDYRQILRTSSNLRFIAQIMIRIDTLEKGSQDSPKDHILAMYKASLCLLFIDIISRLQLFLQAKPNSLLRGYFLMLCENLLKISIHANIEAAQFATLERIVEFIQTFTPLKELLTQNLSDLHHSLTFATKTLEATKQKDHNPYQTAMNYGQIMLLTHKPDLKARPAVLHGLLSPYCPQCLTDLTFGHAQPQCFQCFAQITVCHQSLEICLNETGAFLVKCDLCSAAFSRSCLEGIMKGMPDGERDYQRQIVCPSCRNQYIQL